MSAQSTNLFLIQDLENSSRTRQLADSDLRRADWRSLESRVGQTESPLHSDSTRTSSGHFRKSAVA